MHNSVNNDSVAPASGELGAVRTICRQLVSRMRIWSARPDHATTHPIPECFSGEALHVGGKGLGQCGHGGLGHGLDGQVGLEDALAHSIQLGRGQHSAGVGGSELLSIILALRCNCSMLRRSRFVEAVPRPARLSAS